ncbi:type I restriction-modification system specificity determinant protein, partial [mine drainage metagenome]
MPADMWELWPSEFEESENGEIPRGWKVKELGNVIVVGGGSTPSTSDPRFWDGTIHWATPKDMAGLSAPVLLGTERRLTEAGLAETSSGLLS